MFLIPLYFTPEPRFMLEPLIGKITSLPTKIVRHGSEMGIYSKKLRPKQS